MFKYIPLVFTCVVLQSQVSETAKRYVRVGSLQSHFSAYGSERAWNNSYYEGLIWPADYSYQDNSVIKRFWLASKNFTNDAGDQFSNYGLYFALNYTGISIFPMDLKQTAKFSSPSIYVDGENLTAIYSDAVDEIDPEQIPDRIITNVVNTSMGLTMTRKILVFSQQYHDNYFIKEFTFTNTGNTDWDDDIELYSTLNGVRIGWGTRYSCGREGTFHIGGTQTWAKHSWVTKRGEDYDDHTGEILTESDGPVEWIRCGFQWAGQNSNNSFDNIGGPTTTGSGRLTSPNHVGVAILHVDKSSADQTDDSFQPSFLGWQAGDTYPTVGNMRPSDELGMTKLYDFLSGNPFEGLGGSDRFDESYMASNPDPATVHNDAGGTNIMNSYGPFDLAPGESITIVEAEGANGLSREVCTTVGKRWKQAYTDPSDNGPFILPDGSETSDEDVYKNQWVYTGKDSILLTFSRAKRNYDSGYSIPQPPLPPPIFTVNSGGDRIYLDWDPSPSESESDFAGYKIFRAVGRPDTIFQEIYDGLSGVHSYEDKTAIRGFSYYYYITAFNDGSNNSARETNPVGSLYSSRFYTKTKKPAYLRRQAGTSLEAIRIVPNPYYSRSKEYQYPGQPDKIMFLNIPAQCKIKIFTERGDLIEEILHVDGSGDETWNSISSSRQVVVSGIYIAHFEVTEDYADPDTGEILYSKGESAIRKFAVIR